MVDYEAIEAIDSDTGDVNVIVETPKGLRNKYKFDEQKKVFRLSKTLPVGSVFPFDFGFIPSTSAPDGDPLDILVLMDEATFPGCLISARLLGVIEAQQKPKGEKWRRNDRLIGVFSKSREMADYRTSADLPENILTEIEQFFVSYHQLLGNVFKPIRREGVPGARRLLSESMRQFATKEASKSLSQIV